MAIFFLVGLAARAFLPDQQDVALRQAKQQLRNIVNGLNINVEFDGKGTAQYLRGYQRAIETAKTRALNKIAAKARTAVIREIASDIGTPIAPVRKQVTLQRATRFKRVAILRATGRRIPIIKLKARQTRKGITYGKGGSRRTIPGGFIATMPSGHRGVFKRIGNKRLPVTELHGPSVPKVFTDDKINRLVDRLIDKEFETIFNRELTFALRKFV